MFDMCTVLAKRAERQAEVRALKAAIEARRATAAGQWPVATNALAVAPSAGNRTGAAVRPAA
jgi:hypothetical protein